MSQAWRLLHLFLGLAAAFLSSQSTPLMAHASTYLWLRCTVRPMFKAHRIWKDVKDMGYSSTGMIMTALSTPYALGGVGLVDDTACIGSSCPDKMSAFIGSALLSTSQETRVQVSSMLSRAQAAAIRDLAGDHVIADFRTHQRLFSDRSEQNAT